MRGSPPVYRAKFRVLVVRNDAASQSHRRVVAICLEQNLTGCGSSPEAALEVLAETILASLSEEFSEPTLPYQGDPDPALLATFNDPARLFTDTGDAVLHRLAAEVTFQLQRRRKGLARRSPQVTYQGIEYLLSASTSA
jgi:hypothetical protein